MSFHVVLLCASGCRRHVTQQRSGMWDRSTEFIEVFTSENCPYAVKNRFNSYVSLH